jgi:HAMP domain-containing protein/GGDEF domain-containing protein
MKALRKGFCNAVMTGGCRMNLKMKIMEWEARIKCTKSIIFKTSFILGLCLPVVIGVFSYVNLKFTEKRLIDIAVGEASKASDAIKGSLENAMLSNEKNSIQSIVETVGNEASIEDIKILDIAGQVKYAKNKTETGSVLDRTKIESCGICHFSAVPQRDNLTVILKKADGSRALRNVNPIDNKKECRGCHDPSQKVIGKLLVDFSIKDADRVIKENKMLLTASAAATAMTAVIICAAALLILLKPGLHRLTKKVKETAQGNYDTLIDVKGNDEIALLSSEFNNMINAIKERDMKIGEQLNIHTTLFNISAILKRAVSLSEDIGLILNALNIGLNIEECALLLIKENGSVELKGYVGMPEEKADFVRLTLEELFELSRLPVSREMEEIAAVIGEKEKLMGDEVFVAAGDGKILNDFIVAPLKAGNAILGAITVHKIKDRAINDPEIKNLLSIVAVAMSPYIFIGLCLDKRTAMQDNPFDAFVNDIQRNIDKVEEYQGVLSLAVMTVENYKDMAGKIGAKKASEKIKDIEAAVSSAIDKVHEAVRISEDRIAVLLPMIPKTEAEEIIGKAAAGIAADIALTYKVVTYPEDGTTPEDIVHAAQGNA